MAVAPTCRHIMSSLVASVLSVAINKYFYTILTDRSDGRIQVISSDLRVFETWHDIAKANLRGSSLEIPLSSAEGNEL